jgi:hypothetical protein
MTFRAARTLPACLEAALSFRQLGWSPLPFCPADHADVPPAHSASCTTPGHQPLWPWREYQRRLPSERELRIYWNRNPYSNVGLALGPVSGLVCIVLGRLADGRELPDTLEFLAPDGGRRLLYTLPAGVDVPTSLDPHAGTALECRCLSAGSCIVLPPSRHPGGSTYAWRPGHAPRDRAAAVLPGAFIERLSLPSHLRTGPGAESGKLGPVGLCDLPEAPAFFTSLAGVPRRGASHEVPPAVTPPLLTPAGWSVPEAGWFTASVAAAGAVFPLHFHVPAEHSLILGEALCGIHFSFHLPLLPGHADCSVPRPGSSSPASSGACACDRPASCAGSGPPCAVSSGTA